MRLRYPQLAGHLRQGLSPVYLVSGAEPLQLRDAAQAIRIAAGAAGFDEREVLDQDAAFDWRTLAATRETLSLFSRRRLIELRIATPRLGRDGGAALRDHCAHAPVDDRLLIVAPNLERKELKAAWAQAVDQAGVILEVWPLTGRAFVAWLEERLRAAGFQPASGVATLLAERVEGNMLAAAQEVEKLALIHDGGPLTEAALLAAVGDSARFDVFALGDAALAGERARVHRILAVLAADGTAEALVLWSLAREVRLLAAAAFARRQGQDLAPVFAAHQVRQTRQGLVQRALARSPLAHLHRLLEQCAEADASIKGTLTSVPWPLLTEIADGLARGPAGGRGAMTTSRQPPEPPRPISARGQIW
ncbi:DNA polymerase III, delta subunit [Thioflavicoccus mobilis 8321]|uniref:DNA polymerase III subunit delta n=1 Tax=Thioflavicoccus mobilis 8321 TaxID=765912 RepID=L0GV73_9GAMM|nr:DNA polymerase III subunit delta [Thioflavicoccus mobilis]AGA89886.1 DNA polymerase III, delta subunit [Thioflavicoccus mobilis 8321]